MLCSLQKRLLSSIEAFASTLKVHRKAFEAQASKPAAAASGQAGLASLRTLLDAPGAASYEVKATRFEPAGLVYLWPVTG